MYIDVFIHILNNIRDQSIDLLCHRERLSANRFALDIFRFLMCSELDSCQNMKTLNSDFYRHLSLYIYLPPGMFVQSPILTTAAGKGKVGILYNFSTSCSGHLPAGLSSLVSKCIVTAQESYFKNEITFPYMQASKFSTPSLN